MQKSEIERVYHGSTHAWSAQGPSACARSPTAATEKQQHGDVSCRVQVSLWQEVRIDGGIQPVVIFATVTDRHEDNLAPRPPLADAVPDRPQIGLRYPCPSGLTLLTCRGELTPGKMWVTSNHERSFDVWQRHRVCVIGRLFETEVAEGGRQVALLNGFI